MTCRESKQEFEKLVSTKAGLENKLAVLDSLIGEGNLVLLDRYLNEQEHARKKLEQVTVELSRLEFKFEFLKH
jgi:hypothetical protein